MTKLTNLQDILNAQVKSEEEKKLWYRDEKI